VINKHKNNLYRAKIYNVSRAHKAPVHAKGGNCVEHMTWCYRHAREELQRGTTILDSIQSPHHTPSKPVHSVDDTLQYTIFQYVAVNYHHFAVILHSTPRILTHVSLKNAYYTLGRPQYKFSTTATTATTNIMKTTVSPS